MKRTALKDAIRNIWKKKVSWISVMIVVCLTVAGFVAVTFYREAMKRDMIEFLEEQNFKDLDLISRTGLLPSEIEGLNEIDRVKDVEGYNVLDVSVLKNGVSILVPFVSNTSRVSVPRLVSGKIPEKADEIAVSESLADELEIKVGDHLSIDVDEQYKKLVGTTEFTVVGTVIHPEYSDKNHANCLVADVSAFTTKETLNGGYLRALIKLDNTEGLDPLSEEYMDVCRELEDDIHEVIPLFTEFHMDELRALAEDRIQKETAGPRKKLEKAKKKLANAKNKLDAGEKKLTDAEKQLTDAKKKLDDAETKLTSAKEELDKNAPELEKAEKQLEDGKKQYNEKKKEADQKLSDAKTKLDSAEKEADQGIEKLTAARNKISGILSKLPGNVLKTVSDIESKAVTAYKPALEAVFAQKENADDLLKKAEADTDKAVEPLLEVFDEIGFMDELDVETALFLAAITNGDKNAYSFLSEQAIAWGENGEASKKLLDYLSKDGKNLTVLQLVKKLDTIEELADVRTAKIKKFDEKIKNLIRYYFNGYGKAHAAKDLIPDARETLNDKETEAKAELAAAETKLDDAEKKLKEGKQKYDDGKEKYEKGLKEYEAGKEKYDKGLAEYEKGKAEYDANKKKYEESEKELKENEENLNSAMDDARANAEEEIDGSFAVSNRSASFGYVQLTATLSSLLAGSCGFIALFLVISAMVSFSTVVIIIDEQKKLVGAMKSLGFFNRVIRSKYLIFGLSATIMGIIAGIGLGLFGSWFFRTYVVAMFVTGLPKYIFIWWPVLISAALVILAVIAAVFIATRNVLKTPAIRLINGETNQRRRKAVRKRSGSVYRNLIFRNMRTELPRVLITIIIIAASCAVIGVGLTLSRAYSGMVENEASDVWGYDLKVKFGESLDVYDVQHMGHIVEEMGGTYETAAEIGTIYRLKDVQQYTNLLVLDPEDAGDYFHLKDWKTGKEMELPTDGVLIMNRLMELTGLDEGDEYTLFDEHLYEHRVKVKGVFTNYVGRNVVMSREAYSNLFGLDARDNILMIRLNGADQETLLKRIREEVREEIEVESLDTIRSMFEGMQKSVDSVVYLLTGVAILMSVFVLANLINIFISRRTKEMIIMRVNGFSQKQCVGFLLREAVITLVAGLIVAVIAGGGLALFLVRALEIEELMMNRSFMPMCWVIAAAMEAMFALIIDVILFRKVRKLKVTDIANAA